MIVIVCGLPGVGKTTIAKKLAPMIDGITISSDVVRKELFARPSYTRAEKSLIYDILALFARYIHESGKNCVVDATFNKETIREQFRKRLKVSNEEFKIIECRCPEDTVLQRLKKRKDVYSDADYKVYRKLKREYRPVKAKHITVDTRADPNEITKALAKKLLGK